MKLPVLENLHGDVDAMLDELLATRKAPVAEDYSGPILFVGQAAGELSGQEYYATVITPYLLIGEIDMKRISGNYQRPPIVDYPMK